MRLFPAGGRIPRALRGESGGAHGRRQGSGSGALADSCDAEGGGAVLRPRRILSALHRRLQQDRISTVGALRHAEEVQGGGRETATHEALHLGTSTAASIRAAQGSSGQCALLGYPRSAA